MHSYNVNMHDANVMMENLMYCYAYDAHMHDTKNICSNKGWSRWYDPTKKWKFEKSEKIRLV